MGRISNYSQDTDVTKSDKLLGSDSGGSTKNFSLESVSNFFKTTNAAGVAAQFVWQYKTTSPTTSGQLAPTFSSGVTFTNLQSLVVSKYIFGEPTNSIENILTTLANQDIIIIDTTNQNNYGIFTAETIAAVGGTDNYTITLTNNSAANGSFVADRYYSIRVFSGAGDKTYTHTQDSGATIWEVEHDLGKRPSVTVVDVNNVQGYGIVTHTNANELTITFPGDTTGKAYCN